jgi:hypothetical protein
MAYLTEDRVAETTTTTGTGIITLAGAITGYRSFGSVCSNGSDVPYAIQAVDGSGVATGEWETGIGTWSTGNTLFRSLVARSSNANTFVDFSAGTKQVFLAMLATNTAAGTANEVQYSNSGALAATSGFTFNPASGLSLPSALILSGDITPATLTADQDNYNPSGLATAYCLRLASDNDVRQINGIAGGIDGRIITLINISAFDIILGKEITTSTAANRFNTESLLVSNGGTCILQYDATLSRWQAISVTGDDGGSIGVRRMPVYYAEFFSSTVTANPPFTGAAVATGTSPVNMTNLSREHQGIVRIITNATATANSGFSWVTGNTIRVIGGEVFEAIFMPLNVTGVVRRWGFHSSVNSTDAIDGCYFEITTTGAVVCKTASNSVRTTSATLHTEVINTWYRYKIEILRDGSGAIFSVFNGTTGALIATLTQSTNMPAAGRSHGFGLVCTLTAATSSISLVDLDFMSVSLGQIRPLVR